MYTLEVPVTALAKARSDSDPCGGPLKVIVQGKKKGITSWHINVNLDKKN
jgi:hypothetical protein